MRQAVNTGKGGGAVVALVLAAIFHGCNVVDPEPPPLRIFGMDTVWYSPYTVFDTVILSTFRMESDSIAYDSLLVPNPANPLLNSITYRVSHRSVRLTDLQIRNMEITPGLSRRLDSGLATARYPTPAVLQTTPVERQRLVDTLSGFDTLISILDTIPRVIYPNALPMLGFMPPGDSFLAEMRYPTMRLGPVPVLNFRQDSLRVVSGNNDWPGGVEWCGLDSLSLLWPGLDSARLGRTAGDFILSDTAGLYTGSRPFSVSRVFRNLVPPGGTLGNYWALTAGPGGFLDLGSSHSFTTTPNFGDSIAHLRTQFELDGDFAAEVTVRLAPNVLNGYMVSLFVAADPAPVFYLEPVTGTAGRMSVLSEGAGLCFNVSGTVSDLVSFSYDTYAVERNAPLFRTFRLRCERRGNRFTYSIKDANSTGGFQILRDYPFKAGTVYPGTVFLNMAVGNFNQQGRQLSVEWENFVILEGKVVGP